MALNTTKIERVAGIVAQAVRDELAQERAKLAAENETTGLRYAWPLFFHPIDVGHDWFYGRQSEGAFGRLRRVEQDRVVQRVRELLAPEVAEYVASRKREAEAEAADYAAWAAQAGEEMKAWRDAAQEAPQ